MRTTTLNAVALVLAPLLWLSSVGDTATAGESRRLQVVTTIFPLYDWARVVGGEHVEASLLLPPGVDAHHYSPTPQDMLRLTKADVFLWTGPDSEPWAADLLAGVRRKSLHALDASADLPDEPVLNLDDSGIIEEHTGAQKQEHAEHEHDPAQEDEGHGHENAHAHDHAHAGQDPHVWVDPVLAQAMVRKIGDFLAEVDPAHAVAFRANAAAYARELQVLHEQIARGLADCQGRVFVYGGHSVFGRFAERYGLRQITAARGYTADARPTPRTLADLVDTVREHNAKAIFFEEQVEPKMARVLAEETGAELILLHGAHNLTQEERQQGLTYLQIMRENLTRLRRGLGCD